MIQTYVADIRHAFGDLLKQNDFVSVNREATMTDVVGSRTLEIVNATFIADEDAIFGTVNQDYVKREEEWYNSQSLNVNDIPCGPPEIWKRCADPKGFINSNYGWCIYSPDNCRQFDNVVKELKKNPESRRATMIYTRPNIWYMYDMNGRSDFICTNAVQFLIRGGEVQTVVQMRSNDVVFGFRNDLAWQRHVQQKVSEELGLRPGRMHWTVCSLHVYEKDFYLVDHYNVSGQSTITKEEYRKLYLDRPFGGTRRVT